MNEQPSTGLTQGTLPFKRPRGGRRDGAGRKPSKRRTGVSHLRRCKLTGSRPLHATVRLRQGLPGLRSQRAFRAILRCFRKAKDRFGFRLIHYSVQSSHLHLICLAEDRRAMSRGMQGLLIRVAKALNKLWGRKGSVWVDRYYEHVLHSPREMRNALAYVLNNLWRHLGGTANHIGVIDPMASGVFFDGWRPNAAIPPPLVPGGHAPVVATDNWLVTTGWRRHGLVGADEVPRALPRPGARRGS